MTEQDLLFRYVSKMIVGRVPDRNDKADGLARLCDAGVFLIDVNEEPGKAGPEHVDDLVKRCKAVSPRRIILIKVTVYDLVYSPLRRAGLPVADERIPFPASGWQRKFEDKLKRALVSP